MNYSYFKAFCAVARLGNISKAALELDLTQPAVSRIIANLERDCGTPLFLRSKTGVTLTEEGQRLYDGVKEPFDALDRFEKDILPNPSKRTVTLYIGATYTSLITYCFAFLSKAKQNYPSINIRIHTDSSKNLIEKVEKGLLDFAFITTPFKPREGIDAIAVMKLDDILIAPKSYEDRFKDPISAKELEDVPLILLNENMQFREHIETYFLTHGAKVQPVYEADSSSVLLPFVEHDCGLTFIPRELASSSLAQGKSVEVALKDPIAPRYIAFIAKKDSHQRGMIQKIQEEILPKIKR